MRTVIDESLRREAAAFRLRYSCEHCAHFEVEARACAEGYPNDAHRDDHIQIAAALEFCKSFELT